MAKGKTTGNKFSKLLNRGGDAIIGDRAERIVKGANLAQRQLVDKLDAEVTQLEDKRELMLDHSPDNRYSLTPGKSFEAEKWSAEYHDLSVKITNKKIELAIARANLTDLFS